MCFEGSKNKHIYIYIYIYQFYIRNFKTDAKGKY